MLNPVATVANFRSKQSAQVFKATAVSTIAISKLVRSEEQQGNANRELRFANSALTDPNLVSLHTDIQ